MLARTLCQKQGTTATVTTHYVNIYSRSDITTFVRKLSGLPGPAAVLVDEAYR